MQTVAREPGKFLREMNSALISILRRTRTPMFISAFYLVIDTQTGLLRYANAGHPRPLHLRRSAKRVELLAGRTARPGPALGVFDGTAYDTDEAEAASGDMVMLFTDGLYEVESPRGEFYDQSLLLQAVERRLDRGAEELFEETLQEVRSFSATAGFVDDVCLVAMEVQHIGPARLPDV
jgi:sigma-B regulation protein RsbU (phosphoserine phosphatase)